MSKLQQQGCKQTVIAKKKRPIIESIRERLIVKRFTNKELRLQIFILSLMHYEEKYNLTMNKSANILSKLIANQYYLIIKEKILNKAWKAFQERFQYINLINTFRLIYKAITKQLSDVKDIHEFTSNYQVAFNKVIDLLTATFHNSWKSTKMYFQAIILMNIEPKYSGLVSVIQKD